jgi:hypothetical protein
MRGSHSRLPPIFFWSGLFTKFLPRELHLVACFGTLWRRFTHVLETPHMMEDANQISFSAGVTGLFRITKVAGKSDAVNIPQRPYHDMTCPAAKSSDNECYAILFCTASPAVTIIPGECA